MSIVIVISSDASLGLPASSRAAPARDTVTVVGDSTVDGKCIILLGAFAVISRDFYTGCIIKCYGLAEFGYT